MTKAAQEQHVIRGTVSGFVGDAPGLAEELREELQSWLDGLPENLQSGDKAQALEEAISYLDDVADGEITVPECLENYPASTYWKRKAKESRGTRRNYIVALLEAAKDAAQEFIDKQEQEVMGLVGVAVEVRTRVNKQTDAAQAFIDEVDGWIDTLDGVEFPGMFG